jgi:poly-gamma-glutamate capsule biosynthesis protein CapA/YwtB (metallophosphatase superfamily)
MKTKSKVSQFSFTKRVVLGIVLLLVLTSAFILSEFVFYFPMTYMSLDIDQNTKINSRSSDVTVLIVGDIMLGKLARGYVKTAGYDFPFQKTNHLIRNADLSIGNLEGPISEKCRKNPYKKWSYQVSPKAALGLKKGGFNAMVLANNHIRDCGDIGVKESILHLKKAGIFSFGGGETIEKAHAPLIKEIKGVKIAVFSYLAPYIYVQGRPFSYKPYAVSKRQAGGAYGIARKVRKDIQKVRKNVDVVIVIYHVGDRYLKSLKDVHVKLLKKAIIAGADAVVCHGTHIAGPIGTFRSKPIFYGIGNFAFGSMNPNANYGLISLLYIDSKRKTIRKGEAIPIYTNNLNPLIGFRPLVLKGYRSKKVLENIINRSKTYSSNLKRVKNRIVWKP